jgi:hypothetical protein
MKHTLKISIAPFLFALICNLSLSAATTPSHNNPTTGKEKKTATIHKASHKQTAVKKDSKKFATVCYQYIGPIPVTCSTIDNLSNWAQLDDCTLTCSGTVNPCKIQFDPSTTTLAQALALIKAHCGAFTNTTYTSGTTSVTLFLKS